MSFTQTHGTGASDITGKAVEINISTKTLDWIAKFKKRHAGNEIIQDACNLFHEVVKINSAPGLPDEIYDTVTRHIKAPGVALQMSCGVTRKLFWLMVNFKLVDIIRANIASKLQPAQHDKLRAVYTSAYSSIVNYWFGWNHNRIGGLSKTRLYGSAKDPISVLRYISYLRKFDEMSNGTISDGNLQIIAKDCETLTTFNATMKSLFFTGDVSHFNSGKGQNTFYLKDNYYILDKSKYTDNVSTYITKGLSLFSYPLLTVIFNEFEQKYGQVVDPNSNTIPLILKWSAQQMLWAWGGVYSDMEEEIMQNAVPNMEKITKNNLFLYLHNETFGGTEDTVERRQRDLWLNIAWVSQPEELTMWIKEMWPEISSNKIPAAMSIDDAWNAAPEIAHAYSISFRAYCHPVFAAHVINAAVDISKATVSSVLDMFDHTWGQMTIDRDNLSLKKIIGTGKPHLLWIRQMVKKISTKTFEGYRKQLDTACPLDASGRPDSWGCVCNIFSYEDALRLQRNTINLRQQLSEYQEKIRQLQVDKTRILESQASGVSTINIDGKITPCIEAYSALNIKLSQTAELYSKLLASAKELQEKEEKAQKALDICNLTLTASRKSQAAPAKACKECVDNMQILRVALNVTDDDAVVSTVKQLHSLNMGIQTIVGNTNAAAPELLTKVAEYKVNSDKVTTIEEEERKRREKEANEAEERAGKEEFINDVLNETGTHNPSAAYSAIVTNFQELVQLKELNKLSAKAQVLAAQQIQTETSALLTRAQTAERELAELKLSSAAAEKTANDAAVAAEKAASEAADAAANAARICKEDLDSMRKQVEELVAAQPTTEDEKKAKSKRAESLIAGFAARLKHTIALEKKQKEYDALVVSHKKTLDDLAIETAAKLKELEKSLTTKCTKDMDKLKEEHRVAMVDLENKHDDATEAFKKTYEDDIDKEMVATKAANDKMVEEHADAVAALKKTHVDAITALEKTHALAIKSKQDDMDALHTKIASLETDVTNAKQATMQTCEDEKKRIQAELDLAKSQHSETISAATANNAALVVEWEAKKTALESEKSALIAEKSALSAQILTLTAERDSLTATCTGNAALTAQIGATQAQFTASDSERKTCATELLAANNKIKALEAEIQVLKGNLFRVTQEFDLWKSGAPMPVVTASDVGGATPPATFTGVTSTAMPAASVNTVPVGSRSEKSFGETVDMMALGTACSTEVGGAKPAGCFESANVPCDTPEQVITASCNYGTIPVPIDINSVSLTFSVLDPGSKVKLQLQSALFKYNRASSLLMNSSPVVLDRHLCPLKKLYNYDNIDSSSVVGTLKVPNMQYSRYLDASAGVVARTFFELIYGRYGALKSVEEAASMGVELVQAPLTMYKVGPGSFSGMFRTNKGEIVHPSRVHVHPAYIGNLTQPDTYSLAGDMYTKPGAMAVANVAMIAEGVELLKQAARHLINATMIYIGIAFDNKLVKIPSTSIPAGAFSMLPRADVDALLALAILYPRTVENQRVPDLSMDLGSFEKDDIGSAVSRARAATCEVLSNYSMESVLTGDITLAAKTNPANKDIVMTEAAKRVAEIAMLAEVMNR